MFGNWRRELEHKLDLIYTALVVRDPGTSMAAEAFEGLRKQVIAGATARNAHVAQLAEFDVALRRGASPDDLLKLTGQWLDQAGIVRVDDPTHREAFELTVVPGAPVEVEVPAYVNSVTGQLVRQGRLRERRLPVVAQATTTEVVPVLAGVETVDDGVVPDEASGAVMPVGEVPEGAVDEAAAETAPDATAPSEAVDATDASEVK